MDDPTATTIAPPPVRRLRRAQRRRVRAWMLVCLGVFGVVALVAQLRLAIDQETSVQQLAQALRTHALEGPMRAVTLLGSGWLLLPAAAAVCLALRARHPRLAAALAVTGAGGLVVSDLAKILVIRQRPNTVLWAFPSAHAFGAVLFAGLLVYVLWAIGAPRGWRRLVVAGGALGALAVGVSRVYLNAHWIGDVVGGLAGGLAFLLGAILVVDRWIHRRATIAAGAPPRLRRAGG